MTILFDALKNAKTVAIISHIGPDGDTLGSMMGLYSGLLQLEHLEKIDCFINGTVPQIFEFLPHIKNVKTPQNKDIEHNYDVAIAVDCAAIDRLDDSLNIFNKAKYSINIDHHGTNDGFGHCSIINPKASSVGEILTNLLPELGITLNKEIATSLYVSILTDTGCFKFENTSDTTFLACSKLIATGISAQELYKKCYEHKPLNMIKLQAHAITNATFENEKIAYSIVSRDILNQFGGQESYTDGISEALREATSVEISMLLKETQNGETKISMRSKNVDVAEISAFFGGGGHRLAAGCIIQKKPSDALLEILPIARKQLEKYEKEKLSQKNKELF